MKKTAYFSHDSDARRDPKMVALIDKYGMTGYGAFWCIIEIMREQDGYRLPNKKFAFEALKRELKMELSETKKYIEALVKEFELLRSDEKYFWSESLLERMKLMEDKIEQCRQAGLASAAVRAKMNDC